MAKTTLAYSVLLAAAYVVAGRLGHAASSTVGSVSAVWPASGIAVAAVLLGGRRMLPAIALGALVTALSVGQPVVPSLMATLADTVEPLLAVELLHRVGFRDSLRRTNDVIAFVGLAVVVATGVGAVIGSLGEWVGGLVAISTLPSVWRDWWLGDSSGVLIVGSAILILSGVRLRALRSAASAEVLVMSAVVGMASYLLLRDHGSVPYLVLPLLFVLAFTYRQRGAAIGGLLVSTVAVGLTSRGHGPFPGGSLDGEMVRAQLFVGVGTITALLVAAAQSERRVAEHAVDRLGESESALAEAQHHAQLGSFDTDFVQRRTIWSAELYRILGRDPAISPPGWRTWRQCVHPADLSRVDQLLRRIHDERGADSIVHRIVRPDGQIRMVEARFRFEAEGDGVPHRILGTCQDVTAMKLAEERFRSLFENAPYPIVVVDDGGVITLSNLRAQRLFGFSAPELAGRQAQELIPTPIGSEEPWYAPASTGIMPPADLELRARRRDGSEFPVEVSLTPLVAEHGGLVSAAIRDVTEVRAAAESLTHEARHDALTGLPNRVLFLERLDVGLARARRSGRPLAVIFLDLDDFKLVNDTRGHDVVDELLTSLTPRLNDAVRYGDTIARLGGDEFVVLCEDLAGEADALEIAERLLGAATSPVMVAGSELPVSLSVGVVMVPDPHSANAHGVLRDADAAMYSAKAGGKGRVAVFNDSMRERLLERVAIESSLRGACDRGELELLYQPVVTLERNRVVAAEALLRWRHPIRGLLAPAEFMAVAESSGLIAEIGQWVIEEACEQAARWRDAGGEDEAIPISVNVSAHQLLRTDLAGEVERILDRTGLDPGLLVLEITESTLLEDMDASQRELLRLKQLGVRLIVDDYGTGYSSLSALRSLMIDGLKLDRSFVQALATGGDDGSMVDAVLSMAGALDAEVTAEGVETWAQATRLRLHGCDFAQGFLFARPSSAAELTPLILAGRQSSSAARR